MKIQIPKGLFDILPRETSPDLVWRESHLWQHVESIVRETARAYGFEEIRTPIFERTELFCRSVGEGTDIVSKEMYTFLDKGERSMTLRPEGTAPVMRAFIEKNLSDTAYCHKFFYVAPMFRHERPQSGRYRQHHQFGVEAIGLAAPEQDAEVIDLLYSLYSRLGLKNLTVFLNTLGDPSSRAAFREKLKAYLHPHFSRLSEDSQARFENNPLRILDSKDPTDQEILREAPSLLDGLDSEASDRFQQLQSLLQSLGIPFQVTPRLVRGLDYYTGTVFEVVSGDLGAQNTIGAGGRYDGLIKLLGGPDLPSIGFGCGLERVIQTMIAQEAPLPQRPTLDLLLIPLSEEVRSHLFPLLHLLRKMGLSCQMDFSGKKLKAMLRQASDWQVRWVAVLGEDELKQGLVELKRMADGATTKVSLSQFPLEVAALLAEEPGPDQERLIGVAKNSLSMISKVVEALQTTIAHSFGPSRESVDSK